MSEFGPTTSPDQPERLVDEVGIRLRAASFLSEAPSLPENSDERAQLAKDFEDLMVELHEIAQERADLAGIEGRVLGEMAAENPAMVLELLGGETAARDKIGDAMTDELLADIEQRNHKGEQ